nr:hypothetical protein [Tanacetum cinerariifolium]
MKIQDGVQVLRPEEPRRHLQLWKRLGRLYFCVVSVLDRNIAVELGSELLHSEAIVVKEYQEKDKIESKPNKNGKRGEAKKSQKQLQWIKEEKLKKTQKEGSEMQTHASFKRRKKDKDLI